MRPRVAAAGVAIVLLLAGPARAELVTRILMRPTGGQAGDLFGAHLVRGGDLNGDGFIDLMIAAPRADGNYNDMGKVYVFLGGTRLDSIPDAFVMGRTPSGQAGTSMACVGDVNDDGYEDWLVGSPAYDTGSEPRFPGRAWLCFGGAALDATSDRTLVMPSSQTVSQGFSLTTCALGDVNGDGHADFLASALSVSPDSLGAFVYFGGPNFDQYEDLLLRTGNGYIVRSSSAGDVNGDGWNDVVLGAAGISSLSPGRVRVYFGGPSFDAVPDVTITSTALGDNFGYAISSGGDLNGDGVDDIVVGAQSRSPNGRAFAGQALVYFGGATIHGLPDLTISGEQISDHLGAAVALDGDLDGDGLADLLVGVPDADGTAFAAGRVVVLFGSPAMDSIPDLSIDGSLAGELFGSRVVYAGDPDLGGPDAFVVGSPSYDLPASNVGRAYLCRVSRYVITEPAAGASWRVGGTGTLRWSGADSALVEWSPDGGTTWDPIALHPGGAGVHELEIPVVPPVTARARLRLTRPGRSPGSGESSFSPGEFHVTRAASGAPAVFADGDPIPPSPGRLGTAVAAGVDVDGDGRPDVVAAAPYAGSGSIEIRAEPGHEEGLPARLTGEAALEQFGVSTANAGDLDGDGWDDLVVGAPGSPAAGLDAGRAYVFFGGPGGNSRSPQVIEGRRASELFGSSVSRIGDANGDGWNDLAIGAPGTGGDGRVYVFHGGPGFDGVPDRALSAGIPGPFGIVVGGIGDVNHDGAADLVVSGPPMPGGNGSSSVHVFFGSSGARPWRRIVLEGEQVGDGFGAAFAALGDMDGDGYDDFAIGAPFADLPGALDAGRVDLFLGGEQFVPRAAHSLFGDEAGEAFGSAIAAGSDLNGDGHPDFAIGSPRSGAGGPDAGRVSLWYGAEDGTADEVFLGTPGARLGSSLAMRGEPGDDSFGLLVMGAPFAEGTAAAVRTARAARWRWTDPVAEVSWLAGSSPIVRWRGSEPADVWFVGAGGAETMLAGGAGGVPENVLALALVPGLPDSGRLELRAAVPGLRGRAAGAPVRLRSEVALVRFDWWPRENGVALSWRTDPPLAPGGISAYRLWRRDRDTGERRAVGSGPIADTTAFDPGGAEGDGYELTAIGPGGAELEAGTVRAGTASDAIRAWPQPAGEAGEVAIAFSAPRVAGAAAGDLEVRVFDARGRSIRTLARGRPATIAGVVRLTWDGRTDRGDRAGPGLYFVRARAPSAGYERSRRVVLLDGPR